MPNHQSFIARSSQKFHSSYLVEFDLFKSHSDSLNISDSTLATPSRHLVKLLSSLALACLSALSVNALAQTTSLATQQSTPETTTPPTPTELTVRSTYGQWKMPDGNNAGMLGLNFLVDVTPNLKLGAATYGAVTGEYGGLTTFGLAGELQQNLTDSWRVHGGVFVGGGGGAAGYNQTGNGFMFRADAGLTYRTNQYGNFGLGVSWVTFPSGQVRSAQPYLMYEYPFYSGVRSGWSGTSLASSSESLANAQNSASQTALSNASSLRQEFSLGWTHNQVPSSVTNSNGVSQSSFDVAGVRWTSYLDQRWFLSIQADGSYTGSTSGYTQILGGVGYRFPLGSSTGLKIYGLAGPGGTGSGAVDTGGGLLVGGGLAIQQMLTDHWAIEVGAGGLKATTGNFKAFTYGVNFTYALNTPKVTRTSNTQTMLAGYEVAPLQLRVMNQTYFKADDRWRNDDDLASVNNLGLAIDYFINKNVYITGQGLVAYTGNSQTTNAVTATSELTGLLGPGWYQPIAGNWFAKAEALMGASVGGTMNTGNGVVWQVNAGVGYNFTENLSFSVTGGRMQALDGPFQTNILGASLGYRFGLPAK